MGSSASKAARSAASGAAKRQYPTRVSSSSLLVTQDASQPAAPSSSAPPPTTTSPPRASGSVDPTSSPSPEAFDPQLAASLRRLGPVHTAPTFSHTSVASETEPRSSGTAGRSFPAPSANPALLVLEARQQIAERAEREAERVGKPGWQGREFVDVITIRRALALRDEKGLRDADIEKELDLRTGIVARLGRKGVLVDAASGVTTAEG